MENPIKMGWFGVNTHYFWKHQVVATQIIFIFIPNLGEDEPVLTHIFQMGWNHQPENFIWVCELLTGQISSRPKTRVLGPQKVAVWKGNPLISGKSRLLKYYILAWLSSLHRFCALWRIHGTKRIEKVYLPIHEWLISMGSMYNEYTSPMDPSWVLGVFFVKDLKTTNLLPNRTFNKKVVSS